MTTCSLIIRDSFWQKMRILKSPFFEDVSYTNNVILMMKCAINGNKRFLSFACVGVGWDDGWMQFFRRSKRFIP